MLSTALEKVFYQPKRYLERGGVPMKTSLFGTLAILSVVGVSCNDSGSVGYDPNMFNPAASTNGKPQLTLDTGAGNALTGLALGQGTLDTANTATQNGESGTPALALNGSQFAATAGGTPLSSASGGNAGGNPTGSSQQPAGSSGSSLLNQGGSTSASRNSGGSSGGAGSASAGDISSLGDTRTAALVDPGKLGPNGDGSMSAMDAMGTGSAAQGAYAAGGSGRGLSGSNRGEGSNPFAALLDGGDGSNGVGGRSGVTSTEFSRDPASVAGRADAARGSMDPMGSQDPANYFSLLNTGDNLFKIVERRYVSKSKQWAISDAQQIRNSARP